jgi:hypothetical protein
MRGDHTPERKPLPVEVSLLNGGTMKGKVWVFAGKSLIDALNGASTFVEFTPYGEERVHCLSKAQILTLVAIDIPRPGLLFDRRGVIDADDPHEILGVAPGAAWHKVREAYLQLAKAYHPDRFAGLTLPSEVTEYLEVKVRRINTAYALLEGSMRNSIVDARNGCTAQ